MQDINTFTMFEKIVYYNNLDFFKSEAHKLEASIYRINTASTSNK